MKHGCEKEQIARERHEKRTRNGIADKPRWTRIKTKDGKTEEQVKRMVGKGIKIYAETTCAEKETHTKNNLATDTLCPTPPFIVGADNERQMEYDKSKAIGIEPGGSKPLPPHRATDAADEPRELVV